jgi:hypothetical protein
MKKILMVVSVQGVPPKPIPRGNDGYLGSLSLYG